jgi:hypothetical protein
MATKKVGSSVATTLTKAASAIAGVAEGIACAGTSLESRTFNVGGKAFLFVGTKDARLKLDASLGEAMALARQASSGVRVGTKGWVTLRIESEEAPDATTLRRWVRESHGVTASPPQAKGRAKRGA